MRGFFIERRRTPARGFLRQRHDGIHLRIQLPDAQQVLIEQFARGDFLAPEKLRVFGRGYQKRPGGSKPSNNQMFDFGIAVV